MDFKSIYSLLQHGFASSWLHLYFYHYYYSGNSTLMSLLRFSYCFTPYDTQAFSACSALIPISFSVFHFSRIVFESRIKTTRFWHLSFRFLTILRNISCSPFCCKSHRLYEIFEENFGRISSQRPFFFSQSLLILLCRSSSQRHTKRGI